MIDFEPILVHDGELGCGCSGTQFACGHSPMLGDLAHGVAASRQKHGRIARTVGGCHAKADNGAAALFTCKRPAFL